MKLLRTALAAAALMAPLLLAETPAQALTANQYRTQGHGYYTSSKHRGGVYGRHWRHRHWHGYGRHRYHHGYGMRRY